jgi:hypothetical protein
MGVCLGSLILWLLYLCAVGAFFAMDLHKPDSIMGFVVSFGLLLGSFPLLYYALTAFGRKYTNHLE